MNERDLFTAALAKTDLAERAAFLDEACGGDAVLRAGIEALLAAAPDSAATDYEGLRQTPPGPPTAKYRPASEAAGSRIGPFKLLQQLGEGGMGTVWVAEQKQPVERRVVLKLIKAGMDSKAVLARFEQERQALALMDHPNIAKVLDAGVTDTGRPYFVMELVKGMPITKYCDQEHLAPRERLELFIPVCHAVQHAHQKGIIHRDLKPSNILIALYDGKPVVKVIDFGVAKATGAKLTEASIYTEVGMIVGTLEYMAPEQAELNNLDIDTRADVYSLGVVLYELLTGSPPFSAKQLRGAGNDEMRRVLREVEPSKPSTKFSGSDQLPAIAAKRKLEPKRLTRLVQGDLDWITMKCLEKDRARRYETTNGLALDVQRYLADEPVEAGPPSVWYRTQKFVRRNKGQVIAAALVLFVLIAGILGTSLGLVQAEWALGRERAAKFEADEATKARALAQVNALRDAAPGAVPGILADLKANQATVLPQLQARFAEENDRAKRMRLALALLPVEPEKVRDELAAWMLQTKEPAETLLVRDALRPHSADLTKELWRQAEDKAKPRAERFRALVVLARFDPASPRWKEVAPVAADELLQSNALHLGTWVPALDSVHLSLLAPLGEVFRGERLPGYRQAAADLLAEYAGDQPEVLANLLMDADEKQFAVIYPRLNEHAARGGAELTAEIGKQPVVPPDRLVFEAKGTIAGDEVKVNASGGKPLPAQHYKVKLQAGKLYRLTMDSSELDSFLVLQDRTGKELAFDDDSGGNLNSLLQFKPRFDNTYQVFAAAFEKTGAFQLKIVEVFPADEGKEKLAKRQANAAVALLRMRQADKVWPLLRHSSDPRLRSYLIHRFAPLGASPRPIIEQIDREPDVTIRRALVLSLGEFGAAVLGADKDALTPKLQALSQEQPDPGLRAAAEWLLRKWQRLDDPRKTPQQLVKERDAQLDAIRTALAKKEKSPRWYVNGQGQTMVVIPGPVEFIIGSPAFEAIQSRGDAEQKKRISRSFAIAAREVTVADFKRFRDGHPYNPAYSPTEDCPVNTVTWHEAAEYCNWLSRQEGLQECYEIKAGFVTKMKPSYLSLDGYRLPTEAEWEYACRAGAGTSRFHGVSKELLAKYAWDLDNSNERMWPTGSLKPNDLGLFDMLGNAIEWCQSPGFNYSGDLEDKERRYDEISVGSNIDRVLRGGSYFDPASFIRSAYRIAVAPSARIFNSGFRPARTFVP